MSHTHRLQDPSPRPDCLPSSSFLGPLVEALSSLRCPCLWLCYSPSSLLLNGALYGPVLSEKHDSGTRGQLPRSALLLGLRSLCSVMASRLHQGRGNLTPYNVSNIPFFPLCTSRNSLMSRLQREPQGHCSVTFS